MLCPHWACKVKSLTATSAPLGFLFPSLSMDTYNISTDVSVLSIPTALNLWPQFSLCNDRETTQKPRGKQGRTHRTWKWTLLKSYSCLQYAANCPLINATYTMTCSATPETLQHPTTTIPIINNLGTKPSTILCQKTKFPVLPGTALNSVKKNPPRSEVNKTVYERY